MRALDCWKGIKYMARQAEVIMSVAITVVVIKIHSNYCCCSVQCARNSDKYVCLCVCRAGNHGEFQQFLHKHVYIN